MKRQMLHLEIRPKPENQRLTELLGGGDQQELSNSLSRKLRTWKARLDKLIEPNLYYRTVRVKSGANGLVRLSEGIAFQSRNLSLALRDSQEAVCFIGTIGSAIESEINRLQNSNSLSEAYILDAMGSAAVEEMVEHFQRLMETEYREEGKIVTLRFSPGYCDWSITEQKRLFSLFDSEDITVQLLDSCLMKPRKSISGVFGIAPGGSAPYNPCLDCRTPNCDARRS